MADYHKVLIIKPGAIGDLLQMTPVIRAIRGGMPRARITMLVASGASADLFRHHPDIHETIVFDKRGEHRRLAAFWRLWRKIRAERFDLVINFQRSNLKAWLLVAAAAPCRVLVYHKARGRVVHAVENHLETVAPLGIAPAAADKRLALFVGADAEAYADELFRSLGLNGEPVVALNPGANHPVNRWSPANFARLADRLAGELAVRVVIVGGRDDLPLAEQIAGEAISRPAILTGTTTLLQLGAVLQRCALLVSGDTGPMHMATAVGTRVVALFGAADPDRTGPVGDGHRVIRAVELACVPCRSRRCASGNYLECMEAISVDDAFRAIAVMLAEKDSRS